MEQEIPNPEFGSTREVTFQQIDELLTGLPSDPNFLDEYKDGK